MRLVSSSSEMNDSEDNEYDEYQDEKAKRGSCSFSLPNVTSDPGSSCPYPSAAEEMTRLGLKNEEECRSCTPSGDVKYSGDIEHSQRKRKREKRENMSSSTSLSPKLPKLDNLDTYQKHMGSGNQGISDHSLANESLRIFITTWKETCQGNNADEVVS